MEKVKTIVFIATLIASNFAFALTSCGFLLPANSAKIFDVDRDCQVTFHRVYGYLNYFYLYSSTPLKDLLSDVRFMSNYGGKQYFAFNWVDDPLVTIHSLYTQIVRPLSLQGMTGVQGKATLYVQFLPTADQDPNDSFSGRLRCVTAAGGTDKKSFRAQFCTPLTTSGKQDLRTFESVLRAIRPEE